MQISMVIREILIVQRPVTPRHAVQKLMIITLKQACSRQYSGTLKFSSQRFERGQNQSAPFLTFFFSIAFLFTKGM